MNWKEFKKACSSTMKPECDNIQYLVLGLRSEIGEIDGVLKKFIRRDFDVATLHERLASEIGDVLWYLAMLEDHASEVSGVFESIDESDFKECVVNYDAKSIFNSSILLWRRVNEISFTFGTHNVLAIFNDLSAFAHTYNIKLSDCCRWNMEKLAMRKKNNTISGDGEGGR